MDLSSAYVNRALRADARGLPTFLSSRFPALTGITLSGAVEESDVPPLREFLIGHCDRIAKFRVTDASIPFTAAFAQLKWPMLLYLRISNTGALQAATLIEAVPSTACLSLHLTLEQFSPIPMPCLATVAKLFTTTNAFFTTMPLAKIQQLPKLCLFRAGLSGFAPSMNTLPNIAGVKLGLDARWRQLAKFTSLRRLLLEPGFLGVPAKLPLPHLKMLVIGTTEDAYAAREGLMLA